MTGTAMKECPEKTCILPKMFIQPQQLAPELTHKGVCGESCKESRIQPSSCPFPGVSVLGVLRTAGVTSCANPQHWLHLASLLPPLGLPLGRRRLRAAATGSCSATKFCDPGESRICIFALHSQRLGFHVYVFEQKPDTAVTAQEWLSSKGLVTYLLWLTWELALPGRKKKRLERAVCPTGQKRFTQVSLLLPSSLGSAKVLGVAPDDSMYRSRSQKCRCLGLLQGAARWWRKCGTWQWHSYCGEDLGFSRGWSKKQTHNCA